MRNKNSKKTSTCFNNGNGGPIFFAQENSTINYNKIEDSKNLIYCFSLLLVLNFVLLFYIIFILQEFRYEFITYR